MTGGNQNITKILEFLNLESKIDFSKYISPRNLEIDNKVRFFKNYISYL